MSKYLKRVCLTAFDWPLVKMNFLSDKTDAFRKILTPKSPLCYMAVASDQQQPGRRAGQSQQPPIDAAAT